MVDSVPEPPVAEQMLTLRGVVARRNCAGCKIAGAARIGRQDRDNQRLYRRVHVLSLSRRPSPAAVWVAFDAKGLTWKQGAWAAVALPIWINYMREVLKDKPIENFPTVEFRRRARRETQDFVPYSGQKKLFHRRSTSGYRPPREVPSGLLWTSKSGIAITPPGSLAGQPGNPARTTSPPSRSRGPWQEPGLLHLGLGD